MNPRTSSFFSTAVLAAALAACSGGGGGTGGGGSLPTITPATSTPTTPGSSPTPTATPTALYVSETATASDTFVDTIGINTHLSLPPYSTSSSATIALIANLGARHIRDGAFAQGNNSAICAEEQQLATAGFHFDYIAAPTLAPADINAWTACTGSALEAWEGPNEYDIEHPQTDTNWPLTVQQFQQTLYTTVKANAASANVPVLGPTFTTESAYQMVGNLAAYEDLGNMHQGFAGFNPGTMGYGPGNYGSIGYNESLSAIVGPGKPVVASQTGYTTANVLNGVSQAIQAKYMPRLYFEIFRQGVVRTYTFELCDEPSSDVVTANSGLTNEDLSLKPAYTALQSLISLLSDPGSSFTPGQLDYVVTGAPSDVHHVTLQKRDGSFYVAFWREEESWDPNKLVPIAIPSIQIQVALAATPASIEQYSYDVNENLQPTAIATSSTIPLVVTDSVSILHLVPGSAGSLAGSRSHSAAPSRHR